MRSGLLVLACCSACLGGSKPHYDYFVLTATPAMKSAAPLAPRAREPSTVAVSQVTIPRYLDREAIVTRADDYRLDYSKQDRWAEPLDDAFARTLRQDLATTLASSGIAVPPHAGAPTYDLQIEILRFERRGTDRVELWARWTLRATGEPAQVHEARIQIPMATPASSDAAAALSQAVARLATEIATQVQLAEAEAPRHKHAS